MTPNEMADEVMEHYRAELPRGFNVNWMQEAATMLRQQQAEIEALKQQYELYGAVWHDEHGYQFTAAVGEKVLNDDRWIKLYRKRVSEK